MSREMTREELLSFLRDRAGEDSGWYADTWHLINKWLVRGDGVAVYRNSLIGASPSDVQMFSFGSPRAQFTKDTPPVQLPDIGNRINWRYQLAYTYRGEVLNPWEPLS